MANNYIVSEEQIRIMKHAIGFDRDRVKRGKYVAYRNYYASGREEKWEELVHIGLATVRKDSLNDGGSVVYHVSDEGIEFLSRVLEVKIVED